MLPGGSHELRVEMHSTSDSHDCEGIDTYLTVRSDFGLCGLDADGATSVYDLEAAVGPLVVVVGSEGRGLSRLVGSTCDLRVSIPMAATVESLNASVAAAVTLAEVARRRQLAAS